MNFTQMEIEGVMIIEPDVYEDARGYLMECYNRRTFAENGISAAFIQDNVSRSAKGTLRGLHYQLDPNAQGKLVRVTEGAVFDVAVDIRKGSPTFGKWVGTELSAGNRKAMYVPAGFAHGFLVLSNEAEFTYKVTDFYTPEADRCIAWNDPEIGIQWPAEPDPAKMSERDQNAPMLADAEINYSYD